jgi:hypothetical protein
VIVNAGFLDQWAHKGHRFGECMSHPQSDLMYVHIPKNASSWTKPNLQDWGWEFYNYHTDNLNKTAIVVLRDPVERWVSGIAEYFTLYHCHASGIEYSTQLLDIIFDKVTFDDHTDKQVNFIHNLDTDKCIFMWCDNNYRVNFSNLINEHLGGNTYSKYDYQHVSEQSRDRKHFKGIFTRVLQNSKYLEQVKQYFAEDYKLIEQVTFYGTR